MKKKILLIIASIMIISTIIRTIIVGFSFIHFSSKVINNQTILIKGIIKEVKNKNKFINIIKHSNLINDIKIIPSIKNSLIYDFQTKEIITYSPLDNKSSLKIVFNGHIYYDKEVNAIIQLIIIALLSLVLIILIVNYFLTPYLEILEKIQKSTKSILKGNFDYKIDTKLKGEAKEFIDSYNYFLDKLKESFGVIEDKYTSLIEKEPSTNPLNDAKETIEELANIFKFKKIIEDDDDHFMILNRLTDVIKSFNINHFLLIGIDNNEQNIIYDYIQGNECCDIKENPKECRAYKHKKIVNSFETHNICLRHICKEEYICIPFSSGGNFTGMLKIMQNKENKNIQHKLPYIKAYLNEVSSIIESKYTLEQLHQQNIKDPLTKLYNRRYLDHILPQLVALAKRRKTKIGFLMIDMDYFKKVNDTYGHDAGDKILQTLSSIILNSIRESDIAVRFGGEEFVIILQDIDSTKSLINIAEKIRTNVEKTKFHTGQEYIHKTISIGASLFPENCSSGWECIKYADLALYKAKNTGRNKTVLFEEKLKLEQNY